MLAIEKLAYARKWQKVKQYLYAMNVDMSLANGQESAQLAIVGIVFLNKKLLKVKVLENFEGLKKNKNSDNEVEISCRILVFEKVMSFLF